MLLIGDSLIVGILSLILEFLPCDMRCFEMNILVYIKLNLILIEVFFELMKFLFLCKVVSFICWDDDCHVSNGRSSLLFIMFIFEKVKK